MDANVEKLIDWGCDVEGAMPRFVDDEEFYLECVEKFKKETGFAKLGEALENHDYKEAFEQAHMLKGVSANLGLTPVSEKICQMVESLRQEEDKEVLDGLFRDLMECFFTFCEMV